MDIYDSAAVQKVWDRVLNTPQAGEPDEATLTDWIAGEQASYRTYRAMANRAGRFAPQLRAIAADESVHARRLGALYFLLFGRKPQIFSGAAETARSFGAALRTAYAGELSVCRTYREAAKHWGEHAALLNALADDEERHARVLQTVTAGFLR